MSEEKIKASAETLEDAVQASGEIVGSSDDEPETEIRDTDIVFDCPHCGHNLAIDYRGAGLQIACVNCGESVLVPIPDGMKIDDLDIEPGEILKQLFAARRQLQKAQLQIKELQEELGQMQIRRDALQATLEFARVRVNETQGLLLKQAELEQKTVTMLERMASDLSDGIADEDSLVGEEGGEDGAPSK
ncbi:MAG: hypothetical protein ACI4RA_01525 [Kiritimatiellia bacterium]